MTCFQCQHSSSNPDHFSNGWRLRSGAHARLCQRCFFAYEEGRFCETFHSNDDGWRKCESCDKARNRCVSLEHGIRAGESHHEPSGKSLVESENCPKCNMSPKSILF
ncbi:B3 domain-containing transcription factor VAL3-like isoform X2 [Henckelia pumila]|uniref:B3 domain-containing transcription factor VAL3-like isoform X2 n=1 Tax=Henckelia pumila TaxID=405737 RepID=UPI003C6E6B48